MAAAWSEPVRIRSLSLGLFVLHFTLAPMSCAQYSSLIHDVLIEYTSWDPAFADLFLQTCNFCQTLSVSDECFNSGLFLVVQLDA